jgi:hypothetical protein
MTAAVVLKARSVAVLQKNDIKVLLAPVVPISEAQGSAAKSDGRLNGRITRSVGPSFAQSWYPFRVCSRHLWQP